MSKGLPKYMIVAFTPFDKTKLYLFKFSLGKTLKKSGSTYLGKIAIIPKNRINE